MKSTEQESDLRWWLKGSWDGPGLAWVEPNVMMGATPGAPDVNVPVAWGMLPLELKVWKSDKHGTPVADMRPAQIAYHHRMASLGKRTAIMAAVHVHNGLLLYCIPGFKCPLRSRVEPYGMRLLLADMNLKHYVKRDELLNGLEHEELWAGEEEHDAWLVRSLRQG